MARYNAWQNSQLRDLVKVADAAELHKDRGAFFGSIFGTLNHLLWGDTIWMSRWCSDVPAPDVGIPDSIAFTPDLDVWDTKRFRLDGRMRIWSETLRNVDLSGDLSWHSDALARDVTRPMAVCVAHMFNHQTHHRGQLHAMLSQAGMTPPVSDLFMMSEDV
ncbi:damage-inducible protein DinB [Sulfitobacter sp. SK012]|nr:damage-inducible protein DinB [Sulfitobacter sp. SK012]